MVFVYDTPTESSQFDRPEGRLVTDLRGSEAGDRRKHHGGPSNLQFRHASYSRGHLDINASAAFPTLKHVRPATIGTH